MFAHMTRGGLVAAIGILISVTSIDPPIAAAQQASATAEVLTAKGAWSRTVLYKPNDVVTSRGSSWRATRTNRNKVPGQTAPSTAAFWEVLAAGFNPSNAWISTKKYHPNDLVTRSGSTWRARRTNINKAPVAGPNWEQFAAKGDAGANGADGAQGSPGIQGPPGPNTGVPPGDSTAPGITFSNDDDTGIFSPSAGQIALVENSTLFLHNLGSNNTALGVSALDSNVTGAANVAVGALALSGNTSGDFNTAVGQQALFANTAGFSNTAIGQLALADNMEGGNNTALGVSALESNTIGNDNTALGRFALGNNTTGESNTAAGRSALFSNKFGTGNTALGNLALAANFDGTDNVAIGNGAGSAAVSPDSSIFIGNAGLNGDVSTIKIGTKDAQQSTFIAGIVEAGSVGDAQVYIDTATGQLGLAPPSTRRVKDDIEAMPDMSATLGRLRPVTFRYKKPARDGSRPLQYGLIAEEVAEVMPYLAAYNADGSLRTVYYQRLPALLLAGWQAHQKTIAAQKEEIALLKQRLAAIEARLPPVKEAAVRH